MIKILMRRAFPGFFLHYIKASAEFFSLLPSAEAF